MKQVWNHLKRRRAQVSSHPFFVWLNSDDVALEDRFVFSPVMIDFIMGFADMNKWFLSYAEPENELEHGINEHTEEDRTHSRLFYDNWYTLNLKDTRGWPCTKTLWWLFESNDAAIVRRFGMDVLDLAVNYPEPLVRFAMMEAIEICGDVFFANTAPIAQALTDTTGERHDYYGHYHRERETGHLHTNEIAFRKAELTAEQRAQSELVVDRVFDNFLKVLDRLLSYAQRAVADAPGLARDLEDEYLLAVTPAAKLGQPAAPSTDCATSAVIATSHVPLLRLLQARKERLRAHPFLAWLRDSDDATDLEKLQRFVGIWGVDIVGYKDFNELVLRYSEPSSLAERHINRWTEELATHNVLYLQDFRALRLDGILRWDMGEAVAFYFLSEQTEVHRCNMAKVKKYAMKYKQPALRWWLMKALETSGEPLFECTTSIAERVEREEGITLNYWTGRHYLAHPRREADPELEQFSPLAQPIFASDSEVVMAIINTVFDNLHEQFDLSHKEALSAVFVKQPASLPPPRMSGIVARARESVAAVDRAVTR